MERHATLTKIFGAVCIASGAFYLAAEIIVICYCAAPHNALYMHTISELGIPVGAAGGFSPLYKLMNSALIISGILYIPCYTVCYARFENRAVGIICRLLAVLTGIGVITVGIVHGDNPNLYGIHGIGAGICFFCGNLLAVLTGLFYKNEGFGGFAIAALSLGATGLTGTLLTYFFVGSAFDSFVGFTERLAVYSIIVWLVLTGVYTVTHTRARQ